MEKENLIFPAKCTTLCRPPTSYPTKTKQKTPTDGKVNIFYCNFSFVYTHTHIVITVIAILKKNMAAINLHVFLQKATSFYDQRMVYAEQQHPRKTLLCESLSLARGGCFSAGRMLTLQK